MTQRILDVYTSILAFAGMQIEDDGRIVSQLTPTQKRVPVMIGNEPLVFPNKAQIDAVDQNKVYFHPLSENFLRGESEVVQELRRQILIRLNYSFSMTALYLLKLLGSPELHRKLTEEQSDLLKYISDADDESHHRWLDMVKRSYKSSDTGGFVKLYLKRAGTLKGESYSRLGVITFPFYQQLVEGTYDKHLRVSDRSAFRKLLDFMIPDIAKPEVYNYGTRTQVAPFLDALMMSAGGVASRLNDLLTIYGPVLEAGSEDFMFDMAWLDAFQNLDGLRADIRKMPEFKGNAGQVSVSERAHPVQEIQQATPPPAPAPVAPVPPMHTPQAALPAATIPASSIAYGGQTVAVPAPVVAQPQQVTLPAVRQNETGAINFNDMVRANPVLAQGGNAMTHSIMMAQFPPEVQAYINQYGQLPPNYAPPQNMMPANYRPNPSWAAPQTAGVPIGYGAPVMMGAPQLPPNTPPPPAGHTYQWNPQHGQWFIVPLQAQPVQYAAQPIYQQPGPGGWVRQ